MQEFAILKANETSKCYPDYIETFESAKHILFVIELCCGGDLLSYVRKRRKFTENYG